MPVNDTKYEFGTDADDRILLADEIDTPDSSRYWIGQTYPGLVAQAADAVRRRRRAAPAAAKPTIMDAQMLGSGTPA